ncbi:MAG: YdcH family protein [Lysobacter sp.]
MTATADAAEISRQLAELRLEHRDLDAAIERLNLDLQADELALKRLKKRKLWLKDCIARLESALIPDEPA